ncbi:MAG: hypothetical protein AAFQ84_10590, partial [Pseudomonadota bacterium]
MKLVVAAAAMLLGASLIASSAKADGASLFKERVTASDVVLLSDPSDVEGFGRLIRDRNGVTVELSTSGLDPTLINTVWWIFFNAPQNCNSVDLLLSARP